MNETNALFITGEGIDGSGKTTVFKHVRNRLETEGYKVLTIREPGTTQESEKIRELLMYSNLNSKSKLLLFLASRADLIEEVVEPSKQDYGIILCDRFIDSTIAYQVFAEGFDLKTVQELNNFVTNNLHIDKTFYFEVSIETSMQRMNGDNLRILTTYDTKEIEYYKKLIKGTIT